MQKKAVNDLTMKAIFIENFWKPVIIKEVPIPKPGPGQVLVRMEAAPINLLDLGFFKGSLSGKHDHPAQVGFEGVGTVVSSGGGIFGKLLTGNRVAFVNDNMNGTWAEYAVCETFSCIPLDKDVPPESEALMIKNSITALALVEMIKKEKYQAIVQIAAVSIFDKVFIKLLNEEKIKTISIIRNEEHRKILEDFGAKLILNSEAKGFEEELVYFKTI